MQACFGSLFVFLLILGSFTSLSAVEKHDKFVVVTPPKAGTHLLIKAMEQLTGRKCHSIFSSYELTFDEWKAELGQAENSHSFIQMHALPAPEQVASLKRLGCKVIFLVRDPRDQAVSLYFFIEQKNWSLGPLNLDMEPYASLSPVDKLFEIITGARTGFSGVKKIFARYVPWAMQGTGFVHTTRFEDLVGKEGGGSRQRQILAVTKIAKFLRMRLSSQEIERRSRNLFGQKGEKTFRKGQIGEWKKHFKPRHIKAMQNHFGNLLRQFSYTE
ncbi:MAG: sulfotransferase domain-containing protein [Parachlamydia sp.]|nr:sulfotransferase domain-containing protein [Parachlamydia sp.]